MPFLTTTYLTVIQGSAPNSPPLYGNSLVEGLASHIVVANWTWGGTAKSPMNGPKVKSHAYEPLEIWKLTDDATTGLLAIFRDGEKVNTVILTMTEQRDGFKKVFTLALNNPRLTEFHFERVLGNVSSGQLGTRKMGSEPRPEPDFVRLERFIFSEASGVALEVRKADNQTVATFDDEL